jgi:DNA polymerase-3 subunit epsilon
VSAGRGNWIGLEYLSLDFETSGLDPAVDEVVSLGAVPITSGRIDLSRAVYVLASPSRPVGHGSVPIHGLRPMDLRDSPGSDQLGVRVRDAMEGRQVVAWSAWVEAAFLASMLGESARSWRSRIIDVRDLVVHLDRAFGTGAAEQETLVACAARHGVPPSRAHHALGDAVMTAELFLVVARRLEMQGLGRSRDVTRLGSGSRRLPSLRGTNPRP